MIIDKSGFMAGGAGQAPGSGSGRTDGAGSNRSAWQREMERQELAAWFAHPVVANGRSALAFPVAHASAVVHAMAVIPPAAAPRYGGIAHPVRAGVPQAPGARSDAAAGRVAHGAPSNAAHAGRGSRVDRSDHDVASFLPGVGTAGQLDGQVPMSAAVILDAVMAHLERAPDVAATAGADGAVLMPVAPEAGATATDVRCGGDAAMAVPAAVPTVQAARRLAEAEAADMPSGERTQADHAQGRQVRGAASSRAAGDLSPQLHIHTVRTEDGIRVWIGADRAAGLEGEQLLGAAQDIRRLLTEQGTSLVALTYNGESVWDVEGEAQGSGEQPDRAPPLRVKGKSGTGPRIES